MSEESSEMSFMRLDDKKEPKSCTEFERIEPVILQCITRWGKYNQFIETYEKTLGNRFPEKPNSVLGKNGVYCCRFAPDEIWIIGPSDECGRMINRSKADLENCSSLFDQSQGYTVVELSGPLALDRLSHGVALDLSAPNFSAPSGALTAIDNMPGFILKIDEHPTFWLAVSKSYFSFFKLWWQKIAVQ